METMKAYVRKNGQEGTVECIDMPIPEIDDHEVLVKVRAFGVGIHDRYFIPKDARFPYPIGTEAAGEITKTGRHVTRFEKKDRVMLTSVLQPKGGTWAQYVAVSQQSLTPIPEKLAFTEGAAVPVAGNTALKSMYALDLQEGDTLFVAGASGAIGTFIIQMAASKGVHVAGSASSGNHEYMTSLGAEKAVDYADPDWKTHIRQWAPGGVDVALAIQPETGKDSMDVTRDGGKVITVSGDKLELERNITGGQFQHYTDTEGELQQFASDIASGKIQLVLEHIYPFEQAVEALKKTETRHARGKLVASVTEES